MLEGGCDVLIAAETAGGKTEAAFLPALSRAAFDPQPGIRILGVSPLKALINDQTRRLEEMAEPLGLPVHRWHGDVAASRKAVVIRRPSGVLLITPESLEALFVCNVLSSLSADGWTALP
ncbi:MAG: DEAD/DEAH box helicase [Candidatus Eisenbacteria bacterium]|nr:DEAD/DEAH box helicase [Candidatus Eisenbacteria bacterium]